MPVPTTSTSGSTARAFTQGADIFVRRKDYAPDTSSGQALIAHELAHTLQQGGAMISRSPTDSDVIQRYTDVPTVPAWKDDSKLARTRRSEELKDIDAALAEYDTVRTSDDLALKRKKLYLVSDYIHEWEKKKTPAGVAKSERKVFIDDLQLVINAKLRENLDAHAVELGPLAAEYCQAAIDRNNDKTLEKGEELLAAHHELFPTTAADALTTTDRNEWTTIFFNPPRLAIGAHPFTSLAIKAIADFSWMTKKQADDAINRFILPHGAEGVGKAHILQMLQHAPFRNALLGKATPSIAAELVAKMPIVRISAAAEADAATKGPTPSVTEIADSVFAAFLGDQPTTGLGYATNSADFSTPNFLLGNTPAAQRAPCMTLSNALTEVFKAVLPSGNPASMAIPVQDMVPMLTKPLATIGTGIGILTRETSFHGNVERYGAVSGYQNVNRIFFGDGHEWLQVGNKEYDPTLGISGPVGTVKAQVEPVTFVKKGDKYKASDGTTATRNKRKPPGGAPLLFQRSIVIK